MSVAHSVLDVAGFIPGVGAVADVVNAGLYALEGDLLNAAISLGGALFDGATALRGAINGVEALGDAARAASSAGDMARLSDEAVDAARVADNATPRLPDSPAACSVNSFTPEVRVLLASGVAIPIAAVRVGDVVWATDPETGEAGPRPVTDLIVGEGVKELVEVTIDGEVDTATAGHPFWVDDEGAWVDAGDLEPGDVLLDADGDPVVVDAVAKRTEVRRVHNLTVEGIHTCYVLAGDDSVLVHNCASVGSVSELPPADVVVIGKVDDLNRRDCRTIPCAPVLVCVQQMSWWRRPILRTACIGRSRTPRCEERGRPAGSPRGLSSNVDGLWSGCSRTRTGRTLRPTRDLEPGSLRWVSLLRY